MLKYISISFEMIKSIINIYDYYHKVCSILNSVYICFENNWFYNYKDLIYLLNYRTKMKTIFIVSRKSDFTASRLMEEPALMSHGYICCGIYKLYEMVLGTAVFVGEMSVPEVFEVIRKEGASFRVERVSGTIDACCAIPFTDEPQVLYVSARNC